MKTTDTAGLMAAAAGDVVEPALKAGSRSDVWHDPSGVRRLLQGRDHVSLLEHGVRRCIVALDQPKGRLQVRGPKSDRRRRDRAAGEEFLGDHDRAAIQFAEMGGIQQPRLEVALERLIAKNPLAIDLVLERRFLESPGL